MRYGRIRRLAKLTGATALLDRVGLRGPVGEWTRRLASAAERERWRLIAQDYQDCHRPFRRIAEGAPAGDPTKSAWVISSMPTVWGWKLDGVLSLVLRLRDYRPVAVYLSANSWARRYHRLFAISRFLDFQTYQPLPSLPAIPGDVREFIRSRPTVRDLLALTYRQVDIGRVALSNVLNRNKFAKLNLSQPVTLDELGAELAQAQRNVLAAERMLPRNRPVMAVVLEKGVSPMAEVVGVCLREGIPVVQYVNSQHANDYVFKRFSMMNRHQHPFSLDGATWETVKAMPWSEGQERELMQELARSYETGAWFNRKFLHEGKRIKPPEAVRAQLGLDPARKTAVVFSHVLWDATFFYGESLFQDYETWLLETVRAACGNARMNWVVKLHPDLVWKLKYEGYAGELRDVIAIRSAVPALPEHVKLVLPDTDISTYSFFRIADFCITVRGTIGIEMACQGVPVLTAGTGRYSGLGFTIDSSSGAEYLGRLAGIESLPPMSRRQIELARRFAYLLFKVRPWPMRSFEMVRMPMEKTGHPLDHNVVPHVSSFAELAAADDMARLAEWIDSTEVDFLGGLAKP